MTVETAQASHIIPVILSGGSGTRLWPLSRANFPKQFVQSLNGEPSSLLTATLARLAPDAGFAAPIVVSNNTHRFLVREHAALARVTPQTIVLEPVSRNTAPAIAVAALIAQKRAPGSVLVVMPSDHVLSDIPEFRNAVRRAAIIAEGGHAVLLGVAPISAHTGYGYILKGALLSEPESHGPVHAVEQFVEKPDAATAASYQSDGRYLWNSGIFVFRADTILDEFARHAPDILFAAREALESAIEDLGFLRLDGPAFANSPNLSIDRAVMERTDRAAVLRLDIGWKDVGSWASLWDAAARDDGGNFIQGDVLAEDTTGCYIRSDRVLISTLGVKDLAIVETPGALLVADRSRSEHVSRFVDRLKAAGRTEHEQHLRSYRPWGYFEVLSIAPRFQVKLLHIKPGGILSTQMHHHRSEHWVVVQGTARVTINGTEKLVSENESVYIIATQWHRLENPGKVPLELIEVQIGTYLGEDDIIRSGDIYRRGDEDAN